MPHDKMLYICAGNCSDGFGDISWAFNAAAKFMFYNLISNEQNTGLKIIVCSDNIKLDREKENIYEIDKIIQFAIRFYGSDTLEHIFKAMYHEIKSEQNQIPCGLTLPSEAVFYKLIKDIPIPDITFSPEPTEMPLYIISGPMNQFSGNEPFLLGANLQELVITGEYNVEKSASLDFVFPNKNSAIIDEHKIKIVHSGLGMNESVKLAGMFTPLPADENELQTEWSPKLIKDINQHKHGYKNKIVLLYLRDVSSAYNQLDSITNLLNVKPNDLVNLLIVGRKQDDRGVRQLQKLIKDKESLYKIAKQAIYFPKFEIITTDFISNPQFNGLFINNHIDMYVVTGDHSLATALRYLRKDAIFSYEVARHKKQLSSQLAILPGLEAIGTRNAYSLWHSYIVRDPQALQNNFNQLPVEIFASTLTSDTIAEVSQDAKRKLRIT